MLDKKRKLLLSFVVIGSILILSFQDTLSVFHTLLHQFPNPIHYHGGEGLEHYHHSSRKGGSFFGYKKHSHSHSLEDHLHSSPKEGQGLKSGQKKKSKKGEKEEVLNTLYFCEDLHDFDFTNPPTKLVLPIDCNFIAHTPNSPLGPPPQISA